MFHHHQMSGPFRSRSNLFLNWPQQPQADNRSLSDHSLHTKNVELIIFMLFDFFIASILNLYKIH